MRALLHGRTTRAAIASGSLLVFLLVASPARAAMSNVSLVASNNQVSATGVTYTFVSQVGAADLGLSLTLPSTVTGLATGNVTVEKSTDGSTWSTLSPASKLLSSDGQRVAVNLASALTSGNYIRTTITNLTNPSSAGNITATIGGALTTISQAVLDVAATLNALLAETANIVLGIVAVATNGITNNVSVAPALTFSLGSASHSWSLDPAGTASSQSVTDDLTLATNAGSYVIEGFVSGNLIRVGTNGSQASDMIPYNAGSGVPHFGYEVTGPSGDGVNTGTFHSFGTSAANLVNGWSLSGLTNGEVTHVAYDVLIDYTKSPGTYAGSVTYLVVPTY
ncbi:MAG: hypothetical protein ABR552_07990 [Actinomycetota bacterium]|nr:hypothetical protein [Actinomycetota bacterium]